MSAIRVLLKKVTVEEVMIGSQTFSREDAEQIYRDLSVALGKPRFEYGGCGNRYAHGPHLEGTIYCRGHSFDQT